MNATWAETVKRTLKLRLLEGAELEELLRQRAAAGKQPCPAKIGCQFLGMALDEHGKCWCVYSCPKGLVAEPCP